MNIRSRLKVVRVVRGEKWRWTRDGARMAGMIYDRWEPNVLRIYICAMVSPR